MKLKKADLVFIFLFIILTVISIDLLSNVSHQEAIENISKYEPFQNLATGLLITFWVCVIGNLLPIPTPYTWVVCYSSQPFLTLNPLVPLLVGFIVALEPLLAYRSSFAEPDVLMILLFLLSVYFLILFWQKNNKKNLYLSALFLGLLTLAKPVGVYLVVLFLKEGGFDL